MGSSVRPEWRLPRVEETYIGNPVLGRTLQTMASALTHLNALHARGFAPVSIYQQHAWPSGDGSDVGYKVAIPHSHETIYVPYYVPIGVDLLHVAAVCMSFEAGDTPPELTIAVTDASGVSVDVGCTWTRDAGTLPGRETMVGDTTYLSPYMVESGTRFAAADPGLGSPTDPRRLSVGSEAGTVVIIKVTTVRCQVVSLFICPLPPESV